MSQRAHIGLTDEYEWGVFYGDGTEAEPILLAIGQPFIPGGEIHDAVTMLEAWAQENGYQLLPPDYSTKACSLLDLIEPEISPTFLGRMSKQYRCRASCCRG
jgi:hypothetical protein